MRKQARKKGAHADVGTLDSEPPVEESPPRNPDDASSNKMNLKHDGEKLQMLSAVSSLKRTLAAIKKASMSDR
mgnify:CR=1 FL=1